MKQIIGIIETGSKLYGTSTAESDTDYSAVYVPSFEDAVYQNKNQWSLSSADRSKTNTNADVDISLVSLDNYIKSLWNGNLQSIDFLYGDLLDEVPAEFANLMHNHDYTYEPDVELFDLIRSMNFVGHNQYWNAFSFIRKVQYWVESAQFNYPGGSTCNVSQLYHGLRMVIMMEYIAEEKDPLNPQMFPIKGDDLKMLQFLRNNKRSNIMCLLYPTQDHVYDHPRIKEMFRCCEQFDVRSKALFNDFIFPEQDPIDRPMSLAKDLYLKSWK